MPAEPEPNPTIDERDALLARIYEDLRRLARRLLGSPAGQTLQATGVVHEAYIRFVGSDRVDWSNARYVYGALAQSMRQVLVDHHRRRTAKKRGGGWYRLAAEALDQEAAPSLETAFAVHEALTKLEPEDPRGVEIVKLKFYLGLTIEQIAALLEISAATIQRDWNTMKAILITMLDP